MAETGILGRFSEWIVFSILNTSEGKLAESLNFFFYDSIKIILLVFIMIFIVGFLRTYLPPKKIKKWLSGRRPGVGNLFASMFGAFTPFCSCSSIPIFISFVEAGVPLGITFSFLITSPILNEYLAVIMWGLFGWKITLLYIISGILIGTLAGMALGKMGLEKNLEKDFSASNGKDIIYKAIKERLKFGLDEAWDIVKKMWLWILAGVALGAAIHGFVPEEAVHSVISKGGIFTVPIAVLLGVPIYANCAAIVPVAVVLFQKGIPLGTALAFMMATAALSLPEAIILRRVMKLRLIAIFFGIVALAILFIGYLFNALQGIIV